MVGQKMLQNDGTKLDSVILILSAYFSSFRVGFGIGIGFLFSSKEVSIWYQDTNHSLFIKKMSSVFRLIFDKKIIFKRIEGSF